MGVTRNLISFDWAMKRLLRNKANFAVLEGFLSVLLKSDIKISHMSESEGNQETANDKFNRVDMVATTGTGEIILIELQVNFEADYFHRMLYGTSKTLVEHINISDDYEKLKKVYSVNIVYFDLGQGMDYVYHGITEFNGLHHNDILQLSERQKKALPQTTVHEIFPEYYILKINSFDGIARDTLDEWIYFFKNNEIPDSFKAQGLEEAKRILIKDKMSSEELADYNRHWENVRYAKSMMRSAKLEGVIEGEQAGYEKGERVGLEKGEQIGLEKGKILTTFFPLRSGKSVEEVTAFINLPVDLIKQVSVLISKYGYNAEEHLDEVV